MFQPHIENTFDIRCLQTAGKMQKIHEILTHIRNNALEINALLMDENYLPKSVAHNIVFFFKNNVTALGLLNKFLTNQQQVMTNEELYNELDHAYKRLIGGDPEDKSAKYNNMQCMINLFRKNPEILAFFEENIALLEGLYNAYKTWCGNQADLRKVEEVIYRLLSCKNDRNQAAIDNLLAVMKNPENSTLSDEAKAFLQTPQALYAFAHITNYIFYKINTSPVPKVIRDTIKTAVQPYADLIDLIRTNENRSSMCDNTPVQEATEKLEKISQKCAELARNKQYLALAKATIRYEKAEAKMVAAINAMETSANMRCAAQFKRIHNALDDMIYKGKIDLNIVNEINSIPQFEKFRDILSVCMRSTQPASGGKFRPIAKLPEKAAEKIEDTTIIDDSTKYTTLLLNACHKYLHNNQYNPASNYLDVAKKIIVFFADRTMQKSALMREVASLHILYVLHHMIGQKSKQFWGEIKESYNYHQEVEKFTPASNDLIFSIEKKLSNTDTPLNFDTNQLIIFAIKNYPERISEIVLKLSGKHYEQKTLDKCVHVLMIHCIKVKDWNYLLNLGIRLFTVNKKRGSSCFNTSSLIDNSSFEAWIISILLSYALSQHAYEAAVFKDLLGMVKKLHLVELFFDKLSELSTTQLHEFTGGLAHPEIYQWLVNAKLFSHEKACSTLISYAHKHNREFGGMIKHHASMKKSWDKYRLFAHPEISIPNDVKNIIGEFTYGKYMQEEELPTKDMSNK